MGEVKNLVNLAPKIFTLNEIAAYKSCTFGCEFDKSLLRAKSLNSVTFTDQGLSADMLLNTNPYILELNLFICSCPSRNFG